MPAHKEKIRLTPHFFITQALIRYFVLRGFYIIPQLHTIDNSSLSKFKKVLIIDKTTNGFEQTNSLEEIVDSLNKLALTVKKSYTDLARLSKQLSNTKPIFEWNFLGNEVEKRHYASYLQQAIWNITNETEFQEHVSKQQEIMENPWLILNYGDFLPEHFTLPSDYYGTISQKTFAEFEKLLKPWSFNPFVYVDHQASIQWKISIGNRIVGSGSIIEKELSYTHSFVISDLT